MLRRIGLMNRGLYVLIKQIVIILVLFMLSGVGVYCWTVRKSWMVVTFASIPGALFTYYLLGTGIAMVTNEGRFYSVPFGGLAVGSSDFALFGSMAFWWITWIVVLLLLTRRFRV
jgi:hypothetical protein